MIRARFFASAFVVTSALAIAAPAPAQYPPQPYQPQMVPSPTPDADALAAAMRRLAENPRDLGALIAAGELSLKVGDASGAAALFKRAEGVDPMNGRVKAGMARILVTQERPGEALRYFDQAVGYGLDPRSFAGDRGLAYDLLGEQERAQRDYRLALKAADNDEVRRRYALSLGISGRQDAALAEIDTLLRRNDRGAWRARAFILAMTGDVPGATSIATRMMPPGMAQGLQPFFIRLPTLVPIDKAFAVHFGEVRPTPERLADARLVPLLPVLGPDPDRPIRVAGLAPAAPATPRRERRRRASAPQVQVASAAPKVTTLPPAPGFGSTSESPIDPAGPVVRAAAPGPAVPTQVAAVSVAPAPAPARFARQRIDPIQKPTLADYAQVERYNRVREQQASRTPVAAAPAAGGVVAPLAGGASGTARAAPAPAASVTAASRSQAVAVAASPTRVPSAPGNQPPQFLVVTRQPSPIPTTTGGPVAPGTSGLATPPAETARMASGSATVTSSPAAAAPITATASSSVPTSPRASEDSILARIVAGLSMPGNELGVGSAAETPVAAPAVAPTPSAALAAVAPQPAAAMSGRDPATATATPAVKPAAIVAARPVVERRRTRTEPTRSEPATRTRLATARGGPADAAPADEPTAENSRAGRRRADRRALSDKDVPATRDTRRRGEDRRAVATVRDDDAPKRSSRRDDDTPKRSSRRDDEAKSARAEAPRIWVQVAGGANQGDLPKAWSAVQSRASALKGRAAYSTPLRATNRVVTGPFKTDAEARAFVNQLAKQGVSAFPFTSDKGQKLAKLPPR